MPVLGGASVHAYGGQVGLKLGVGGKEEVGQFL